MRNFRQIVKQILLSLRTKLSAAPQPELSKVRTLCCRSTDLDYICCSNIVCRIAALDGYFCECRRHTAQTEYVRMAADDYFSKICSNDETTKHDREKVLTALSDPRNAQKFLQMGENRIGSQSPCARFISSGDLTEIGLAPCADDAYLARMKHFVGRYAWCAVLAYRNNRFLKENAYQVDVASKVIATSAVANLLGLSALIPPVEYVQLKIDNAPSRLGTFMKSADGICGMDVPYQTRRSILTPEFQKAMNALHLLDIICHEGDHSPNNYNIVLDDHGMAVGLSVFDNNGVSTFSINPDISFTSYKACSAFVTPNGEIARPYMSRELAQRVLAIRRKSLNAALHGILNPLQISCTYRRLKKLQKAISITAHTREGFLLDDHEWSEQTIEEELSGKYGKTYLCSFLNDCLERTQYTY